MNQDIHTLADTIYHEAGHKNISVMEAIANVVLNRLKHACFGINPWWGKTITEVCLKPAQFTHHPIDNPNDAVYQICRRIAVRAVKGLLPDNTKGATCYHPITEHPKWAYSAVPCAKIGDLLFYDIV